MTNNAIAAEPQSSEKGKNDGQSNQISTPSGFWFPVYEGLFEHCPKMLDAVWLFMWLIARTTRESNGIGKVLGGIPIPDDRPAGELGVKVKTVRRWRRMLVSGGYTVAVRTGRGFIYTLPKSKKLVKLAKRDFPKPPISAEENARNGHSDLPPRAERVPDLGSQSARSGQSNKTIQRQHREEAEEEAASATATSPKGETKSKPHPCWEDIRIKPCGVPKFLRGWESAYDAGGDESLVDLMEGFIQSCQAEKIPVPPQFYQAKHRMQAELATEQEPEALAKMNSGGPRLPKEMML